MSEKKKFMPTITNYLSDDDEEVDVSIDDDSNTPPVKSNYSDWKRSKKTGHNLQNGNRYTQAPFGDISSCEEDSKFDDNEQLHKIMNCLADKEAYRKRNDGLRRRHKKPSHFLLFSRMKQQKHFDLSFNDLCQIAQDSWENLQSIENEELLDCIDKRIDEYKDVLLKFKTVLLPDYNPGMKLQPHNKPESLVPSSTNNHISAASSVPEHIPERLQNLAGNASVYNAPDKTKRAPNHRYRSQKTSRHMHASDTSLNYVAALDCQQCCKYEQCGNRPIDDYRWDGEYCSARCLIRDCNEAFQDWLTEQRESLAHGDGDDDDKPRSMEDNDDEIMLYLASPSKESLPAAATSDRAGTDEEDVVVVVVPPAVRPVDRNDNIFESLQNPGKIVTTQRKKRMPTFTFATDIDAGGPVDLVAASRLHSLISRSSDRDSPIRSDGFDGYFHDRSMAIGQQQSVTETSL